MSFQVEQEDFADTLIVGLGHKAQSGKDTVADWLVRWRGFERVAFADRLKEVAAAVFGFNREQLYGNLKEVPDEEWNDALVFLEQGEEGSYWHQPLTPRIAMQKIGTESFRRVFHEDIWVAALFRGLKPGGRYVITDVRFSNEANAVLDAGGYLWKVSRDDQYRGSVAEHESERALDNFDGWDAKIFNNFSLNDLYEFVEYTADQTIEDFENRTEVRLQTTSCLGCLGQGAHNYADDCGTVEVSPI